MTAATYSNPLPLVPDQVPSLDNTLGAILVGTFIGLMLYGLVFHQCYRYYRLYPKDSAWIMALVLSVLAFETFHMVLAMHICYHYLVTNYSHPYALLSGTWSVSFLSVTSGFIIILAQSFFARRIYLLGGLRYRVLVALSFVLFVAELGFFVATVEAFATQSFLMFQKDTWFISGGAAAALVGDGLLTAVLVNLLRTKHIGDRRMDRIIETLILYSINTGLLTGIVNLLALLFSLLYPNNLVYAGFGIVATKLYANSLLAALNTRCSLRYTAASNTTVAARSGMLVRSRRETTGFEMHGHVATSPQKAEIQVEHSQAHLTFELMGIAV